MNMILLCMINFILVTLEVVMLVYLASGFFESKVAKLPYYASVAGLTIVVNVVFMLIPNATILVQFCFAALNTLWIFLVFRCGIIKSLFIAVLLSSYIYVCDSIFVAVSFSYMGNDTAILNDPFSYYLIAYAAKVVELFGIVVARSVISRYMNHRTGGWATWVRVLFYPLVALIVTIQLMAILIQNPNLSKQLFTCLLILLTSDFLSVFLLDYIERQQEAVQNNVILRHSLKLAADHVHTLEESYGQQRKLTHDFKNQLAVVRNLAEAKADPKEIISYLDKLVANDVLIGNHVRTNRLIADMILNQKISEAKSQKINVKTQLDDLMGFPLPDDALVVVLSNLLDNALEACVKIPNECARSITVKMKVGDDSSLLCIENTTSEPVIIRSGIISTTKKSPVEHGFGLKNVCAALDQYNASYVVDYQSDGSKFCFIAQIPT